MAKQEYAVQARSGRSWITQKITPSFNVAKRLFCALPAKRRRVVRGDFLTYKRPTRIRLKCPR